MKERIKKILSVALTLSLLTGILGAVASVKAYATEQYTILFDPNGGVCDVESYQTDENGKLSELPGTTREGFEFIGWFFDGTMVTSDTTFSGNRRLTAMWQEIETVDPQPAQPEQQDPEQPSTVSETPPAPKIDNDQDEGDHVPTAEEVADKQLDDVLKDYKSLEATGNDVSMVPKQEIKLDLGNSVSFSKATYEKIDEVSACGIPVTLNYVYKGEKCSLTIPGNLPFGLQYLCDETGFLGFEKLRFYMLIAGSIEPDGLTSEELAVYKVALKELQDKVGYKTDNQQAPGTDPNEAARSLVETRAATTTFVNAGADMLASQGFSRAANAVVMENAEQSKTGAEGGNTSSGFTPFAAFGGSSMRAESG